MNGNIVVLILSGILGGSGLAGLAVWWTGRDGQEASAAATLIGISLDQARSLSDQIGDLRSQLTEVRLLVTALQDKIDEIELERERAEDHRNWWRDRANQLAAILEEHGLPIPPPLREWTSPI